MDMSLFLFAANLRKLNLYLNIVLRQIVAPPHTFPAFLSCYHHLSPLLGFLPFSVSSFLSFAFSLSANLRKLKLYLNIMLEQSVAPPYTIPAFPFFLPSLLSFCLHLPPPLIVVFIPFFCPFASFHLLVNLRKLNLYLNIMLGQIVAPLHTYTVRENLRLKVLDIIHKKWPSKKETTRKQAMDDDEEHEREREADSLLILLISARCEKAFGDCEYWTFFLLPFFLSLFLCPQMLSCICMVLL